MKIKNLGSKIQYLFLITNIIKKLFCFTFYVMCEYIYMSCEKVVSIINLKVSCMRTPDFVLRTALD